MAIELKKAGLEDMIQLDNLNEEALLQNVQVRFNSDLIYTYTGTIIVSVNPFKILPIYTSEMVKIYCGKRIGELPPHIFATADSSYRNMRDHRANQSVIISGESGAGKSESTKLILQYLAAMTDNHAWVEQQILEANTILEAFGNAKTVRNNNSSRFGKFVEIHFDGSGKIVGARFIQYLLEKSRVTQHSKGERNYHVFYQLCAGTSKEEKDKLHLKTAADYAYCNVGGAVALEGVDDAEEFQKVKLALTVLGIGDDVQNVIFKILAAILILGELQFEKFTNEKKEEGSKIKNIELLEDIADLLAVDSQSLANSLTRRNMTVRGQNFQIPLKANEASDTRDALAKALYGKVFSWLVDRINSCIYKEESENFIGVLDIFGFENFVTNSFEQLCINYANEKLQQFFNQHIFKLEQEEYTKEKIPWQSIAFVDNQECLELVEKRPVGLLSLLDEECKFPNGTDATFLDKVTQKFAKHKNFATPKRSRTSFIIKHYAGEVAYEIASFLDKNKDTLYEDLVTLIQTSETEFLAELFADYSGANVKKSTVGAQFKEQLNNLVQTLANTTPHYVRCIKPNKEKMPNVFTKEMVLEQLRYSGMLETIRIRKSGYPIRYSFESFFKRYGILNFRAKLSDPVAGAKLLLTIPNIDPETWRVGVTKVFMRDIVVNQLDDARKGRLGDIAKIIQRRWRTYKVRKQFKQSRAAALAIQTAIRARGIKNSVAALRASTTIMQATIRMYHEQKQFVAQRKAAIVFQNRIRFLCTPSIFQRKELATILQTKIRKVTAIREYTRQKNAAFVLQSAIRMAKDKAHLQTLKTDFQKRLASDEGLRKQEEERKKRDEEERKKREEERKKQEEEAKKKKEEAAKAGDDDDEDLESAFEDMLGDILDDKPSKSTKSKETKETKETKEYKFDDDDEISADKTSDDFEKEFMSVLNDITSAASTPVASTASKAPSKPAVKVPRTFVLDDEDDNEIGSLDEIEKQFADLDNDDDIFADFGAELDADNNDDEPEDKASKSITKMLKEMKDSGLKSRDRAELVRANATTNRQEEDTTDRSMLDALDKLDDILSAPTTKHEIVEGKDEDDNTHEITISHPDEEDAEDAVSHPDGASTSYDQNKTKAVKDLSFNVYFDFSDFRFQDYATSRMRPYSIGTLRKKQLPILEMIQFTKSPIPQSMLKLAETLSREAVELFGAIMRFMADSGKKPTPKQEVEYAHFVVSKAIGTEGLRDEIFCGLIRQVTKNPKEENAVRGWQLLALCLGCVPPSEILIKYLCGFLQNTVKCGGFAEKWAQLCLKRLQRIFVNGPRTAPPSSVEINSIKSGRPIIIRIQLMDRKAKALDFDTSTNSKEIITNLAQKLELREKSGFAIYEKVDPTTERWISPTELLGDLLYKWETQGWSSESADPKIVFKKRIFINAHHEPSDPVCKDLLFYQALEDVLQDRFPVTEVDVMRLASLEMQIIWGDHDPSKVHIGRQLMTELDRYIPQPMIPLYSPQDWKTRISEMHATLKGRSAEEAKALYMQHVMKWPLYGSTIFTAKASVAGAYGSITDLCIAVNQEGVYILARSTKQILDSIDYPSITVMAHTNNTFDITARIGDERTGTNSIKRGKFSTKMGAELEKLCRAYSAVYRKLGKQKKRRDDTQDETQPQGPEHEIVLPAPLDADRYTFTAYAEEFLQNKQIEFTKEPIKNSMHKFENAAHDKIAVDIFVLIMKYMEDYPARLNTQVGKKKPTQAELAQQIISKALKIPKLRNEVYCQLMKQTNSNPTLENEILGWQLLAVFAGTFLPSKELMNYVRVHFQEGCKNKVSMEVSLLSALALRKLQRTILNGVRTVPPSSNEMAAITKRKTLITKIHTLDGSHIPIPTDGSTTMKELFATAVRKLEVKEVNLFALYNVVDHDQDREVSLKEAELLGDIMAAWEENEKQGSASFQIVLKRRDFFNATIQDPIHPIDRDLHFFQFLYNVVHSRYPVTEADAVYLAGLHINLQYGNFDPNKDVIAQVVSELEKYLPKTLISQHSPSDWRNKLLESYSKTQTKSPDETKALYMTHMKKWTYYGCTIFSAKQTLSLNLPKELWLGIAKDAVHVFQPNKKDPVASFPFTQIANWGPSAASFFIMTGSFMQPQKYVFITKQGNDMSDLLHLYINRLVSHK